MNKNKTVYRSKDQDDWEAAQKLLKDAGLSYHFWTTEDVPAGGCGAKFDVRRLSGKAVPKTIFHIEVDGSVYEKAADVLRGRVLPVLSYGTGI